MAQHSEASRSEENEKDERKYKIFNDSVHGHIKMHPLLVDIIDTPEFQRLRNIKQMGGIYYVFPGASHNRFEHSIGVGHLAGKLVQNLKSHRPDITREDMFCVQIAGLCHDLGHGPFSHLFDDVVKQLSEKLVLKTGESKTTNDLKDWKHEAQSGKMFDLLIENTIKKKMKEGDYKDEDGKPLRFTEDDFTFIHELIEGPPPSSTTTEWHYKGRGKEKSFLYEIVANKLTGIDVDKMDYISRDCLHLGMKSNFSHERFMMFARVCTNKDENKDQICMRDKEAMNMYELFHNRYMLHHNVCQHRVKVAIEMMIVDALLAAEGHFKIGGKTISDAVMDPKTFLKLTDDVLREIMRSDDKLKNAKKIISRIEKRDLYKFIHAKKFKAKLKDDKRKPTSEEGVVLVKENVWKWLQSRKDKKDDPNSKIWEKITKDDFATKAVELNYGKEEKNPIKYLRFYSKNNPDIAEQLDDQEVSHLLPKNFSEIKVMLFYKGEEKLPENPTKDELFKE